MLESMFSPATVSERSMFEARRRGSVEVPLQRRSLVGRDGYGVGLLAVWGAPETAGSRRGGRRHRGVLLATIPKTAVNDITRFRTYGGSDNIR